MVCRPSSLLAPALGYLCTNSNRTELSNCPAVSRPSRIELALAGLAQMPRGERGRWSGFEVFPTALFHEDTVDRVRPSSGGSFRRPSRRARSAR
jgi:hypothetical protein